MHHHYYVAQHSTLFIRNFRIAFPIIPFLFTRVSKSKNNHPHLKPAIQKFKHGAKFAIEMREKQIPAARKKEMKKKDKQKWVPINPPSSTDYLFFLAQCSQRDGLCDKSCDERFELICYRKGGHKKPARWNEKSQAYLQHDVTI